MQGIVLESQQENVLFAGPAAKSSPTPPAMTFADHVIAFHASLHLDAPLPEGIGVMNPFAENPDVSRISSAFYRRFYDDTRPRGLILGINPGRLGGGATGVPFTDTKRLAQICDLVLPGLHTHEPSSVFVYEVIDAYGGPAYFYGDWYINSVCPLGFVQQDAQGRIRNYNYYDSKALATAIMPFAAASVARQVAFGIRRDRCLVLGSNQNYAFVRKLNQTHGWFAELVPLEHPRYIMQYRSKQRTAYIDKYLAALTGA
ncbi:MAG: SMUG2 DNA glycosylase family protein [Bacteroidia bacterium]